MCAAGRSRAGRGVLSVSAYGGSVRHMLDIQFIREHADIVKESQRKRGESVELVDEVLRSDETRRSALKEFEEPAPSRRRSARRSPPRPPMRRPR